MADSPKVGFVVLALVLTGAGARLSFAQQSGQQVALMSPGEMVRGVVHRLGDERYRLTFSTSGVAYAEVSGAPADCVFQVGSQGFQESDSSPADWTDGRPGQAVRHSFRVQAGRPGTVWVLLRSRLSSVSINQWSGVACSGKGPFYTTPDRGASSGLAPGSFEGRPVHPPIAFHLTASAEGTPTPPSSSVNSQAGPVSQDAPPSRRYERQGFSLECPSDWSAVPAEEGTSTLSGRAGTAASEARAVVTVVPKSTVPDRSAFQVLLGMHQRLADKGAELVTLGPTTVGGEQAAVASHVYDDSNAQGITVPFDHVLLVLDHAANYYLVAFSAPHEVFVRQTTVFKS